MVGEDRRRATAVGRIGRIAFVAAGLFLMACEPQKQAGTPPISGGVAVTPTVIGERAALPSGCQPDEVVRLVTRFFDAVNRGDQTQIGQVYAITADPAGLSPQGWYSVDWSPTGQEPRHFTAYTQDDLFSYFRERYTQHERLRLLSLQVRAPTWHGGADITYFLSRSADDLADGERPYGGKGAINCARQQLFVWSMTDTAQPPLSAVTGPAGRKSKSAPLVPGRPGRWPWLY